MCNNEAQCVPRSLYCVAVIWITLTIKKNIITFNVNEVNICKRCTVKYWLAGPYNKPPTSVQCSPAMRKFSKGVNDLWRQDTRRNFH